MVSIDYDIYLEYYLLSASGDNLIGGDAGDKVVKLLFSSECSP
jgi:hypothetical protein